ncbi:hypothetical protein ACLHDG_05310 [Sulfurovum sp. CS9]|uniref:hypothetical protein n=1 Tax=Sulfurovum sp. CS9 TaxID=3391146 RepID=UPI0039EBD38E
MKIKLELSFDNLKTFKELIPDEWTKNIKRETQKKRLLKFSNETFKVIADKKILQPKIDLSEGRIRIDRQSKYAGIMNPYTKKRVKGAPKEKRVLYVELVYSFEEKPKVLEFVPPLDKNGYPEVNMGFVTYHNSVPVTDFRYLNQATKLNLNWDDAWYSYFENKNLTRHHKYPLMGYLYLEPRLVRVETLMRVDDISKLISFEQTDQKGDKLELLKKQVQKYFQMDENLLINGRHVKPDNVKVDLFRVSITGLKLVESFTDLVESSVLVGVSKQYHVDKLPQSVESKWVYFNENVDKVPFDTIDPVGPYPDFIYRDDPMFRWKNHIKDKTEPKIIPVRTKTGKHWNLPIFGEINVWSELPTQEQGTEVIKQTLENVRTAFIEKKEERLDQELSKVLLSKNSESIKKELSQLFAPSVIRGGIGAIEEFGTLNVDTIRELKDEDGFSVNVSGDVKVIAKHWGHSDRRALKYQFIIDMIEKDGEWFIKDFSLLGLKDKTS